jgi:hypothetical protein
MGIAAVDSDDTIARSVGTHGQAGSIAVRGGTRAASGATVCKSGQTTGWTCGRIGSYDITVVYTDPTADPGPP